MLHGLHLLGDPLIWDALRPTLARLILANFDIALFREDQPTPEARSSFIGTELHDLKSETARLSRLEQNAVLPEETGTSRIVRDVVPPLLFDTEEEALGVCSVDRPGSTWTPIPYGSRWPIIETLSGP